MKGTLTRLTIFTLFTIFVTVALASIIGNFSFFSSKYSVKAYFTDATGVLKGDLVKIAGVNVGKVTEFQVEGDDALVTMEINGQYLLPKNVIAEVKFRNLLGQRIINLSRPDIPSTETLEDGDVIPIAQTRPALDLSIVFNNLRPLIQSTNPDDINTVARSVLAVFKGREGDLESVLGNLGELSETLVGGGQRLNRLITDLNDLAQLLNKESGNIKVGVDRFTELMEALAEVTPSLKRAVANLDKTSRKFGEFLVNNKTNITQDLKDLAYVLGIVTDHLGPLDKVAKNLKEVLLATARSQSYGEYWNLYVVNLCPEYGGVLPVPLPGDLPAECPE